MSFACVANQPLFYWSLFAALFQLQTEKQLTAEN